MVCDQCGRENEALQKFCGGCGARLQVPCRACGTVNPPSHRFCGECGSSLTGRPPEPAPGTSPVERSDHAVDAAQERRVVSVLFADLVGFTPYAESRDPEEVRAFLTTYFDTAREIVERFGGIVEKFIGDAVMGVWGATVTREDDAERTVRAALELVDGVAKLGADAGLPELALRAGVLTGEAAVGTAEDGSAHVVGDMVNTASRLQSAASPGTALVGEPTYRACQQAIAFEAVGEVDLKGKALPVEAWRASHVLGMRGGGRRADGLEPPFVGRDEELRLLKDQLHATGREGRSRLVSITGIAGIGKSRLVWELMKYTDGLVEPIFWHEGRSPAYGEGIAFWALAEMVRGRARIAETDDPADATSKLRETLETYVSDEEERSWLEPRLAGLLGLREMPAGQQRGELFSAFRRLFERISERGTTVLVLDDLHWADAGLLDFVEELPEWSRDKPILIVTMARPELLERRPAWGAGRRNFISAHLGPLADEPMRELMTGLVPGIPEEAANLVEDRAAGIPMYAVELVRMLVLDERLVRDDEGVYRLVGDLADLSIPESLHAAIAARLDRLDAGDRALIQDAAVVGHTFTLDVLAALTGHDGDELAARLSELVRRELLTFDVDPRSPERGQYGFLQSLIREVAYSRLARADRRARHLSLAHHLEATGDTEVSGIIADHYLNALRAVPDEDEQLREQALGALRDAAARATALHSHEQVLAYCERALDLVADTDAEPEWWERAARSAHSLAHHDVAEDHAQRLVAWHADRDDRRGLLRAKLVLARILTENGESRRALEVLEPVAAELHDLHDDPDGTELVALLARAHLLSGNLPEAATVAERALIAAERLELLPVVADAMVTRGTALGDRGRPREGTALLKAALELARAEDLPLIELRASGNLAYVLWADEPALTHEIITAATEEARRLGERGWLMFFVHNLIGSLMTTGRWDEVLPVIDDVLDGELDERDAAAFEGGRASVLAARGRADEARELLDSIAPIIGAQSDPQQRRAWYGVRSWVALAAGDAEEAYELATVAIGFDKFGHPESHRLAAQAALMDGSRERMVAARDAIDRLPRLVRLSRGARSALAAGIAVVDGDTGVADEELAWVRDLWSEHFPTEHALFLLSFGDLAADRHPAAEEATREGRELATQLGLGALLELYAAPDPAGS